MSINRPLRVFLCHSSNDKPAVRELYQKLRAEPWIQPWLDEENLLPGQDWDMEIEKAAETADAVIVCLSNNSVTKEGYVQREIKYVLDIALEKPEGTIFIIPLRLEDCRPPRKLLSWQYVDYFPAIREPIAYEKILASLRLRLPQQKVGDVIILNALYKDFQSPQVFLSSHLFCQVCHKYEMELVANKLGSTHAGFSANFLDSDETPKFSKKSFAEMANSSHLLVTINLWDIPQIPDTFWVRMPCDKNTIIKLLEEKRVVYGVQEFNGLITLLVAATANETLDTAIIRFLEMDSIPK